MACPVYVSAVVEFSIEIRTQEGKRKLIPVGASVELMPPPGGDNNQHGNKYSTSSNIRRKPGNAQCALGKV
jgi:hypothetical protein